MNARTVESSAEVVIDLNEKRPIRVLHVDDDTSFLKTAKPILEMQGAFQVDMAPNVEEAIEKMKTKEYDIVVCDYQMPGKDGLQFLKELRENGNNIPFIVFTGKGREEVAIKALNLGADGYFSKTGSPETVYGELAHGVRLAIGRKKAEMEIWQRKERLRAILASSPDAIIISDLNGNIVDCNEATLRLTGYSSKEEIVGKSSFEFIAEKDRERALKNLEKTFSQGTTKNLEYALLKKGKKEYQGELSASVLKDSSGNLVGFVAVLRDITERKIAEEALKESEEKYRNLFENARDVIVTFDLRGNVTSVNKAVAEYDFKMDEFVGKNMLKFVSKKYWPKLLKELGKIAQGKSIEGELELNTPNGKKIAEYKSNPIKRQNRIAGFQSILRDVTERKKAEDALRESEEKYKDLFENAMDVILTLDLKGNITAVNSSVMRFGYKKEDLVGKSVLDFIFKEYWPTVMKDLSQVTEGEPVRNETEIVVPAGNILVEYNARAILKENNVTGVQINLRDVTERKRVEEAVRSSEAKLRAILASSPEAISVSDLNAKLIDCNEAFLKLHGYVSKEELIGTSWFDVIAPQNRSKIQDTMKKLLEHGYIKNIELALLKRGSQEFLGELSASLVLDSSGKPTSIVVVARDITERKKMEEELKESEERLRNLYESVPDALGVYVGKEGHLIHYNKAFKKTFGYSEEELKNKTHLDFIHPDYRAMLAREYRTEHPEDKLPFRCKVDLMNKNGEIIPTEISVGPYKKKGRIIGVEVVHRDITERKKAEQTILESQKKFERLFMDNPEPAVSLDQNFHILDVNPRFTALFGYALHEIKGKHINDVTVPKEKMKEAEMLDRKLTNDIVYHDTVRKRKDGSLVPVSISAAPLIINNQILGHVAVYKDISQLKKTERELAIMNEKLCVVGGLTRHDVRNKLSAITGNTYLAKKELASDSKVLDYLNEMEKAVQQIVRIFEFAKAYEMLGAEELVYINVEKTVDEAISLFSHLRGVKIKNDCHGLSVLADSLLRQLFYNLIDNSLKHGQKTTGLKVYYEKADQNQLKLIYEDDGAGIAAADKPKLFTEGYSTGGGSGYGLYLIKKMTEVYGWTIQETGEPSKGARYVMTIPRTNSIGRENYKLS
jgi:PAS domain S-box-containing protein